MATVCWRIHDHIVIWWWKTFLVCCIAPPPGAYTATGSHIVIKRLKRITNARACVRWSFRDSALNSNNYMTIKCNTSTISLVGVSVECARWARASMACAYRTADNPLVRAGVPSFLKYFRKCRPLAGCIMHVCIGEGTLQPRHYLWISLSEVSVCVPNASHRSYGCRRRHRDDHSNLDVLYDVLNLYILFVVSHFVHFWFPWTRCRGTSLQTFENAKRASSGYTFVASAHCSYCR